MKKILLCTDGSPFAENSYPYAAWFAKKLDTAVDILCVTDFRNQQAASTGNWSGSIGLGASENLLNELVEIEHKKAKLNHQRAKLILQNAKETLQSQGVAEIYLIHRNGFLVDSFPEFEAQSDLTILGKRGENADFASKHLGANLERILRSSHKPCLVTPRDFQPIERLLIAYDGSKSCQKILQFLLELPIFQGLELHLLTVVKKAEDENASTQLQEAESQVKSAGFNPICTLLQGESEKVISKYVTDENINLLLMGAYGHSRIRKLVIGSTTAQTLRSSHIPVFLFR